jgi:hypothetical protein
MSTNQNARATTRILWSTPRISELAPDARHPDAQRYPDTQQYVAWAARARRQANEATTDTARAIHLGIAEDYERKAGIR